MAAIEDIVAWCRAEQARLAHRLELLHSGHLHTYDKTAQPPGWFEVDTTQRSIELCRQYISELNAIVAHHHEVQPTPAPAPAPAVRAQEPAAGQPLQRDAVHHDWLHGWGVVKGNRGGWECKGAYATRAEADAAAAAAGKGYYVRWGSLNERTREFTSGPSFERF